MKEIFNKRFQISDLNLYSYYFGIRIQRNRIQRKIWLNQTVYMDKVLYQFNIENCILVNTPITINIYLKPVQDGFLADPKIKTWY